MKKIGRSEKGPAPLLQVTELSQKMKMRSGEFKLEVKPQLFALLKVVDGLFRLRKNESIHEIHETTPKGCASFGSNDL